MADNKGNKTIFRQKSLDRVSGVEDMDKYIKTTTPSLWLLLTSIIVFLVVLIIWSTTAKINIESVNGCSIKDGLVKCVISEEQYESITDESFIEINNETIKINNISGPFEATLDSDLSILHISNIETGSWYYELSGYLDLSDGEYKGKVVFKQVSPIAFVIN